MIAPKSSLLALLLGVAGTLAAAAPKHDLYLAATISRNYVIGSKLVTLSGLYQRADDGKYQHFGPNFPHLFQIAFDPRDRDVFYVASLNGCLVTRNGGETFRFATSWDMTEAKDVSVDPHQPDHVYLALPDGIAVSTDRGMTWTRRENGLPERGKYTQVVKPDRARAGRFLAGCESGIYLSEDHAGTWRRVLPTRYTVTDIRQSPHDPAVWLASTQANGIQISRDGGATWTMFGGMPIEDAWYNVAFDPTNPRRYAVSSWTYGVYTTEDAGVTWAARNAGLPEDHVVFRVGIDPDNGRLLAGVYREALFVSDDFGRTWRNDGLEGSTIYNFVFLPQAEK
jgi:photosystem II stability/assembly factor-like uncharacterized protein